MEKPARPLDKTSVAAKKGFTLIEVLVVVTLIGISVVPLLFNAQRARYTQNLRTSAALLASDLALSKISARDARDQKAWGIASVDETHYQILSGNPTTHTVTQTRLLDTGVTFADQFTVWFGIGTGSVTSDYLIKLGVSGGQQIGVSVSKNGVVQSEQL